KGEGFEELIGAIEEHRRVAFDTEAGARRRRAIARFRLEKTAENLLMERFLRKSGALSGPLAERLSTRDGDPYSLANTLLEEALGPEAGGAGARS
ncbi:MAG: GTPase, partial [Gaiellales bacterium]|nr:GTPase [Gaiellales bacterium]